MKMGRLLTVIGMLASVPGARGLSADQATAPSGHRIGFHREADLFECLPGDKVSLVDVEDGKSLRWDVNYVNKQFRMCAKKLKPGELSGMTTMRFRCRADAKHQLWLQLNEASGEKFYKIITLARNWKQFDLRLTDLTLNKDKVANGRLDVDQVTRIVIVDFSALSSGSRTVWFSDWEFASQAIIPTLNNKPTLKRPAFAARRAMGKVGMTCVPRNFQETEESWVDFFSKANETGVQVLSLQAGSWRKAESSPGVYSFKSWDNFFVILDKHGFEFELSKDIGGPFFLDKIDTPKDIRFQSFADPVLLGRYKRFVAAFLDRFGDRHAYVVIHAEGAETYFRKHPDQLDDYCRFLSAVRTAIKSHSPHIQVGVNTDTRNQDLVLTKMAAVTDFMAYDVMKGKIVQKPADFEPLVKRLTGISDPRRIAFQNAGWSTSKTDRGSDEEQVEFIREFYRVLHQYRDKIEYASFGSMYDHDPSIIGPAYRALFADLPATFVEKIIDSMSHFGLFRSDGSAKPGWYEFKKQVAGYYQRN